MLSWRSHLKQKAVLIHTNANICEPRAQTWLLTNTRDGNCSDPVRVFVLGGPVCFKDQTISFADGSVRNPAPAWGTALNGQLLWCARSNAPTRMQTFTLVHTEAITSTKRQCRVSRHSVENRQRGVVGLSWQCGHSVVYWWVRSGEQPGQPVWPPTPAFTLAHCGAQGHQDAGMQQHNRCRQVK